VGQPGLESPAAQAAKNSPVDCFLGRGWRGPWLAHHNFAPAKAGAFFNKRASQDLKARRRSRKPL